MAISTKNQKFLYDYITASVYTSHTGEMDDAAAGIRAQIAEATGKDERNIFVVEFAYVFTFTADLNFEWPTDQDDMPPEYKNIERAWEMHAEGHSITDVWSYYHQNVPTPIADMWVSAVVAGQSIWKPRAENIVTAEAAKRDPNS